MLKNHIITIRGREFIATILDNGTKFSPLVALANKNGKTVWRKKN